MLNKLKRVFFNEDQGKDFKEILVGGSTAFIYRTLNMLLAYTLMVFISRTLGEQGIGIYNLCLSFLSISVMLSCLGFNTSIVRFVSQYNSTGEVHKLKRLYASVIKLIIPLSILAGIILYFMSEYIAIKLYSDPELLIPLRILSGIIPLSALSSMNVEFIRGLKLIGISELFRNLGIHVVVFSILLILSLFTLHSYHPLLAYLIGSAIAALFTLFFILRHLRKRALGPQAVQSLSLFSMKEHLFVSLPMILTSFIILVNGQVDTMMLGLFKGLSIGDVGVFSVALKISVITNFMIGAIKSIAMPKISELFWGKKMQVLDDIITRSTRYIFYFAAPVSFFLILFPEQILSLVGTEFIGGAGVLRIFALAQLINASSGLVAVFLNMTGNQLFFTKLVLATTLGNIVLNIILIPEFGMEGAAFSTLLATGTWNIIGAIYIYKKYNISTFFKPGILKSNR